MKKGEINAGRQTKGDTCALTIQVQSGKGTRPRIRRQRFERHSALRKSEGADDKSGFRTQQGWAVRRTAESARSSCSGRKANAFDAESKAMNRGAVATD